MKKLIVAVVAVLVATGLAACDPPKAPPGSKPDGGNVLPLQAAKKSKKIKPPKFVLGEPTSQVTVCVFKSSNCGAKK